MVIGGAGNNHQVALWDLVLAADQLADWSDRINDGCTRRVGHETLQWLQNAGARGLTRKRKHIGLSWLETGDRGLQHLYQALI